MTKNSLSLIDKNINIKESSIKIIDEINDLVIKNDDDLERGVVLLSEINKINDRVDAEKSKIIKPLLLAISAERKRWKPIEDILKSPIESLRRKMSEYSTYKYNKNIDKQDKIKDSILNGEISLEKGIKKLEKIDNLRVVSTESGSVKFRSIKRFEVVDITKLPSEYILPNEPKIREAMGNNIELDGVRYFIEQVPYNQR